MDPLARKHLEAGASTSSKAISQATVLSKWKLLSRVQLFATLWTVPGSSVHGILQARILEWVAIPFSRGSSWPRDWTQVSYTADEVFKAWATSEAQ